MQLLAMIKSTRENTDMKRIEDFFGKFAKEESEEAKAGQPDSALIKVYNAQNIVEAGQIIELLKENGIIAIEQEAGANVTMYGSTGFGLYGVDILVRSDCVKKALQAIKETNDFREQ